MFLLVPAHLGSPGQRAVKRLLLLYSWPTCARIDISLSLTSGQNNLT